ncbi:MAG TPA: copper homeostasis membrane protein CopD [Steroidobacteraceae bacterium]|nr:copper homeostasis membrane protein CopD [Steroidobacteraceae bacterium]
MIDAVLILARLLQFTSTLALFGSALFLLYAAPAHGAHEPQPAPTVLRALMLLAAVTGVVSGLAWLSAEADLLTGAWTSVIAVVTGTRFGMVLALRVLGLTVVLGTCILLRSARPRAIAVAFLGGLTVASFAWTGHGSLGEGAGGSVHAGADVLHLLAAGLWLGALMLLGARAVRTHRARTAEEARTLLRQLSRFSALGPAVVAALTLTGLVNAWYLIGLHRWSALLNTAYGLALLVKLVLFFGMLLLAMINRSHLTPQLQMAVAGSQPLGPVLGKLRTSLLAEAALGALVLVAVSVLGMLEPPISLQ